MNLKRLVLFAAAILLVVLACVSCTGLFNSEETDDASLNDSVSVPILMYHHIAEKGNNDTVISTQGFEEQISALADAGYTAVFYADLIAYVEDGTPLPDKPIVITFDDGYESNLSIAAPILEKYGMCGTIAVVGVTEGAQTYKDTGVPIFPHFSLDDEHVKDLMNKGVIDIQMHTFDMHQVESLDGEGCRLGALIMDGEAEDGYIKALTEDYNKISERILETTEKAPVVYTYPYGKYSALSEDVVRSLGARITVTTDAGVSKITKGDPDSLYLLKRFNISDLFTGEELIDLIENR